MLTVTCHTQTTYRTMRLCTVNMFKQTSENEPICWKWHLNTQSTCLLLNLHETDMLTMSLTFSRHFTLKFSPEEMDNFNIWSTDVLAEVTCTYPDWRLSFALIQMSMIVVIANKTPSAIRPTMTVNESRNDGRLNYRLNQTAVGVAFNSATMSSFEWRTNDYCFLLCVQNIYV